MTSPRGQPIDSDQHLLESVSWRWLVLFGAAQIRWEMGARRDASCPGEKFADWLAVQAVLHELFSHANSLLTGKNTGNSQLLPRSWSGMMRMPSAIFRLLPRNGVRLEQGIVYGWNREFPAKNTEFANNMHQPTLTKIVYGNTITLAIRWHRSPRSSKELACRATGARKQDGQPGRREGRRMAQRAK